MTEYLCLTLLAEPGEAEGGFKARLAAFWTHVLRTRPEDYAKVYAEAARFGSEGGLLSRQYMAEAEVCDVLVAELAAVGIAYEPVDPDDTYSKYEAAAPEWFQIPH